MKALYLFCFGLLLLSPFCLQAQQLQSLDTIQSPVAYENIYSRPVYSDSLVSSFVILIRKEVRPHRHATHTEQVYILEGEGEMTLGERKFRIRKGDLVTIPKNTVHALKVLSPGPVKVLSVQAPFFDGKDRIFTE